MHSSTGSLKKNASDLLKEVIFRIIIKLSNLNKIITFTIQDYRIFNNDSMMQKPKNFPQNFFENQVYKRLELRLKAK